MHIDILRGLRLLERKQKKTNILTIKTLCRSLLVHQVTLSNLMLSTTGKYTMAICALYFLLFQRRCDQDLTLTMMMKMTGPAKPHITPFWTLSQQQPSAEYLPEADASVMVTISTGRPERREGNTREITIVMQLVSNVRQTHIMVLEKCYIIFPTHMVYVINVYHQFHVNQNKMLKKGQSKWFYVHNFTISLTQSQTFTAGGKRVIWLCEVSVPQPMRQ